MINWFKKGETKIFITSDTHFCHANIMKYTSRPENWEDIVIQNWNKIISNDDLVIHMGDFLFGGMDNVKKYLKKLNGRKILVRGNHDGYSNLAYIKAGFIFSCDEFIYGNTLFTHEPVFIKRKGIGVNIHGHIHNADVQKTIDKHKCMKYINVGTDLNNLTPLRFI